LNRSSASCGRSPGACARALERLMEERGVRLPVAIVDGDDLMPRLTEIVDAGITFPHLDTGEPIGEHLSAVNSANAPSRFTSTRE